VSARLAYRPARDAEHAFLAGGGTLSETARLRAMARSPGGERHTLVELQAVDGAYPLYGSVALAPAQPLAAALMPADGVFGAVAEAAAADRIGVKLGDRFRIGDAVLRLAAILERQPDAALGGLVFAACLAQIMALALIGIAGGLLLGGAMPALIAPLLQDLLPVSLRLGLYPAPLSVAALCGLLATLLFSLWPLAAIGRVPPGA